MGFKMVTDAHDTFCIKILFIQAEHASHFQNLTAILSIKEFFHNENICDIRFRR